MYGTPPELDKGWGDSDCVIRKKYERMYGWIMDAYFIRTFVLELLFRFEDQDEEQ